MTRTAEMDAGVWVWECPVDRSHPIEDRGGDLVCATCSARWPVAATGSLTAEGAEQLNEALDVRMESEVDPQDVNEIMVRVKAFAAISGEVLDAFTNAFGEQPPDLAAFVRWAVSTAFRAGFDSGKKVGRGGGDS